MIVPSGGKSKITSQGTLLFAVSYEEVKSFIDTCVGRGVEIKWFGAKISVDLTSSWDSWRYIKNRQSLPRTRKTLDYMCDFRIPLTFSLEDCQTIAAVIRQVAEDVLNNH